MQIDNNCGFALSLSHSPFDWVGLILVMLENNDKRQGHMDEMDKEKKQNKTKKLNETAKCQPETLNNGSHN